MILSTRAPIAGLASGLVALVTSVGLYYIIVCYSLVWSSLVYYRGVGPQQLAESRGAEAVAAQLEGPAGEACRSFSLIPSCV